jgi:hypothetical protein
MAAKPKAVLLIFRISDDIRRSKEASIAVESQNVSCHQNRKGGQWPPSGKRQIGGRDQGRYERSRQIKKPSRRTEVDAETRMQIMRVLRPLYCLATQHLRNQRSEVAFCGNDITS